MDNSVHLMADFIAVRQASGSANIAAGNNMFVFNNYATGTPAIASAACAGNFYKFYKIFVPGGADIRLLFFFAHIIMDIKGDCPDLSAKIPLF